MSERTKTGCPNFYADKQLEDAHRSWHAALTAYQNPDDFAYHLNHCIQEARNLTFHIQAQKQDIPDFDNWYKPWQQTLRSDVRMSWLNSARVQVVHKGDLAKQSVALVRVITDYFDAAREVLDSMPGGKPIEIHFDPMESIDGALEKLQDLRLPERVLRDSYATIERRWVTEDLPDNEILETVARCIGLLQSLVRSLHSQTGCNHAFSPTHAAPLDSPGQADRMPCMLTTRAHRTFSFGLRDGRLDIGGSNLALSDPEKSVSQGSIERYLKYLRPRRLDRIPMNAVDWLPPLIEIGLAILRSGEDHGWFIFFFRGRRMVGRRNLVARDAMDKRAIAQEIAEFVATNGIDGVVDVAEVWTAPLVIGPDGVPVPAAEHKERREALVFYAATADGSERQVEIPFERRRFRKRPIIEDPQDFVGDNMLFLPTREVWRSLRDPSGA